MESLIIFIIIGIVSAFFNKDKKPEKKPTRQMPSFGQQTNPENSEPGPETRKPAAKSLEDFANEIFGQLNEKNEKPVSQHKPIEIKNVVEEKKIIPKVVERKDIEQTRRSERPPLTERPLTIKVKEAEKTSFIPKTKQDLIQGIIMAEVLGKPKARR